MSNIRNILSILFPSNRYGWMLILFLLLLLPNFSVAFLGSDLSGNLFKQIAYLSFSVLLFLIPILFLKARTYFVFASIFLWLAPIEIGHILFCRMPVSVGLMSAILHTTQQEASEFIRSVWIYIIPIVCILGLYYWILFRKIENKPLLTGKGKILFAGFFLIFNLALFIEMWRLASFTDADYTRMERTVDSFKSKYRKVYPCDLLWATSEVLQTERAIKQMNEQLRDFSFHAYLRQPIAERELYVLVIGESARYGNFSINGYERETSPLLAGTENLISYSQVLSTANLTETALRQMLTRATPWQQERAYQEKALTDAFRECGFHTAWIGNQSAKDDFIQRIVSNMDAHFFSTTDYDATANYDEKLLPHFDEILRQNHQKQFVVIHTLGSHFRYNARYPESFTRFTPALQTFTDYGIVNAANKELLVNSYDNTICYTDSILHEIIQRVANTQSVSAVVYISDHAENLYDDDRELAMHGSTTPTKYELHVPLFIWTSESYKQARKEKACALQQHKACKVSTTNLFPSLLDIAGIAYPEEELQLSIASSCFQEDSVWYIITPDKRVIKMK